MFPEEGKNYVGRTQLRVSSVIVSVYRDAVALQSILYALSKQSTDSFEVVVSEDGHSDEIQCLIAEQLLIPRDRLLHVTQEDIGFRKNRALNNAIRSSRSDHLIFIDGDCIPSIRFVAAHQALSNGQFVTAGRRLELGPRMSDKLRRNPTTIRKLSSTVGYLSLIPRILIDRGKNVESGLRSGFLHRWRSRKPSPLLGCNFSCPRRYLEQLNGFNEEYEQPGIGEDTDLQWRLEQIDVSITDAKFMANLFHLHHDRAYGLSPRNVEIFDQTVRTSAIIARRGLFNHHPEAELD